MASSSRNLSQAELEEIIWVHGETDLMSDTPDIQSEDSESEDGELSNSDHSDNLSAESSDEEEELGKNSFKWYKQRF